MLWMYQRTFLGKPDERQGVFADLSRGEWVPVLPLIVLMVWLGSYTQSFMPPISAATAKLLDQTSMSNEYRVKTVAPVRDQVAEVRDAR